MMVIFGAPLDDAYHEEHAVLAAVEMQREVRALCAEWESQGRLDVEVIVSAHTYEAVRPLFQWKPAGTVAISGRCEPLRAYALSEIDSKSMQVS